MRRIGLGGYAVWRVLGRSEDLLIVREEERPRVRFELNESCQSTPPLLWGRKLVNIAGEALPLIRNHLPRFLARTRLLTCFALMRDSVKL